jgi:hypothetical protein
LGKIVGVRRAEAMDWALAASPPMVCWVRHLLIRRGADVSGFLVATQATGMILSGRFAVTAARLATRLAALGVGALGAWLLSVDGGRCWPGRSR